jgi:SAM-dependent methyltransferase
MIMEETATWEFETLDACLLCDGRQFRTVFRRDIRSVPLQFVKCDGCELVFQNPRLTQPALARYFSSSTFIKDSDAGGRALKEPLGYFDYLSWDESYKRTARFRLTRLARYGRPPGRLLEIGTSTGSFLDEARRAGFSVRGLDVSATFANMARSRYGLDIDVEFIEDAELPDGYYDVVCNFGGISCWRDPLKGLRNIRRTLKPDGVLMVNHPNINGLVGRLLGGRYPEYNHASLTVFSDATMRRCFEAAGFRVAFAETERQYASLGRIATYLRSRAGVTLVRALRLEHSMIPVIAWGTTFCICVPDDRETRGA